MNPKSKNPMSDITRLIARINAQLKDGKIISIATLTGDPPRPALVIEIEEPKEEE